MKKNVALVLTAFVVVIIASSFVSATSITSATYEGSGLNSFMGGAHAYAGSDISHNSTFTSTIEINISDCKDKFENFTGTSDIESIEVTLNDTKAHTSTITTDDLTVSSCYVSGDTLYITVSGTETQRIHSSSEIGNMLNYDNATVKSITIDTGDYKLTANS